MDLARRGTKLVLVLLPLISPLVMLDNVSAPATHYLLQRREMPRAIRSDVKEAVPLQRIVVLRPARQRFPCFCLILLPLFVLGTAGRHGLLADSEQNLQTIILGKQIITLSNAQLISLGVGLAETVFFAKVLGLLSLLARQHKGDIRFSVRVRIEGHARVSRIRARVHYIRYSHTVAMLRACGGCRGGC